MDRRETQARVDAQIDEWKRNLDIMGAKAEASSGAAKVEYLKAVSGFQEQLAGMKIQAAKTWDVADDLWASTSKDLEIKWEAWQQGAKKAWDDWSN